MPRPYGTWSDEQLSEEMSLRKAQIADNEAAREAHMSKRGGQSQLAHASMRAELAREGAALSKDMVSLHFEIDFRKRGEWKRL